MQGRREQVLSLIPEQRFDLRERARTVQRALAKLAAEQIRIGAASGAPPFTWTEAEDAANVERMLRQVVIEYAAILRHLGTAPEVAVAEVKQLVGLVAREPRRAAEETRRRVVRWAIEGYYAT